MDDRILEPEGIASLCSGPIVQYVDEAGRSPESGHDFPRRKSKAVSGPASTMSRSDSVSRILCTKPAPSSPPFLFLVPFTCPWTRVFTRLLPTPASSDLPGSTGGRKEQSFRRCSLPNYFQLIMPPSNSKSLISPF